MKVTGIRTLWLFMMLMPLHAQGQEVIVVEYIHTDAQGTPIAVTDASGTVIERFEYEPYGLQVAGPVEDGPGYSGHVEDTLTSMTYMQQRYYDPQIGRFLSVDPVTALSGPFNRYWYSNANPYKFTDPDGRQSRDLENEYKVSGAKPPPGSPNDKIGPVIGVALTIVFAVPIAVVAAPVVAAGAKLYGVGLVATDVAGSQAARQVAGVVATVVKHEATVVANAAGAALKSAEIAVKTSPIALGAIKHYDAIVDAIDGASPATPPPMTRAGVASSIVTTVVEENRD